MSEFVYDGSTEAFRRLPELVEQGTTILCPKCGAELIVALDAESARRHTVRFGVYCSKNSKHFYEMIELR